MPCNHWSEGGRGSVELAQAVRKAANQQNSFRYLYDLEVRLNKVATTPKETEWGNLPCLMWSYQSRAFPLPITPDGIIWLLVSIAEVK